MPTPTQHPLTSTSMIRELWLSIFFFFEVNLIMVGRKLTKNLDRNLNRTLVILSIVVCVVVIGTTVVGIGLTTVINDPPEISPSVTATVRIYNEGKYYTQDTFKSATVSGSITFVATITAGVPTSIKVEVFTAGDPQGTGTPITTVQLTKDSPIPGDEAESWRTAFDTTMLENGEYWFFVRASDSSHSGITLSIFGFSQSDDGGSGDNPPFVLSLLDIVIILILAGIVICGVSIIVMYIRKRR